MEIINSVIDSIKYFLPVTLVNSVIVIGFVIFVLMWVLPRILNGLRIVRNFYHKTNELFLLPEQFKNNGGSSLRDVVDKIQTDVSLLGGRLNSIFYVMGEDSGIAVFEADETGKVIYVCKRFCELTGLDSESSLGSGWLNAIDDSDVNEVSREWDLAIAQQREFHSEYSLYNKLTEIITKVRSYSLIIRNVNGKPTRYLVVIIPNEKI